MGIGGEASYFAAATSTQEVQEALSFASEKSLPVHVLGGGSNTLFADAGWSGLVLAIRLTGLSVEDDGRVVAAAGERWDDVVQATIAAGLAGFEALSGIPGLVGATPMQNVGAYGQHVADVVKQVTAVEIETGELVTFAAAECQFGYRTSRFKAEDAGKYVITEVAYQLDVAGVPQIRYPQLADKVAELFGDAALEPGTAGLEKVRKATLALRRSKSMVIDNADPNTRSCGSFFVNPKLSQDAWEQVVVRAREYGIVDEVPGFAGDDGLLTMPAAWLIEHAGFAKGDRRGGVGISENHPLALINVDGTCDELLVFADEIVAAVQERFDITLEREPVLVG